MKPKYKFVKALSDVSMDDVAKVGGKAASLGEMLSKGKGLPVLGGYVATTDAYWHFLRISGIKSELKTLMEFDVDDILELSKRAKQARKLILSAPFPFDAAYDIWNASSMTGSYLAVRSSATAEDSATASFAGQQDTILGVQRNSAIQAVKRCYASMFSERAISYRQTMGFDHLDMGIAVVIQQMLNAYVSGVAFSLDPKSGFRDVVHISATYGLGEGLVSGLITPDQWWYYKPKQKIVGELIATKLKEVSIKSYSSLKSTIIKPVNPEYRNNPCLPTARVDAVAEAVMAIEKIYEKPVDVEFVFTGSHSFFIVQARPETVFANRPEFGTNEVYMLLGDGPVLLTGQQVSQKIGSGVVELQYSLAEPFNGGVLVAANTDPSWEPKMKRASAIITDNGGPTCHAAIVSRELGIPAIVGTGKATELLKNGNEVTVCGNSVLLGIIPFRVEKREEVSKELKLPNGAVLGYDKTGKRWWKAGIK